MGNSSVNAGEQVDLVLEWIAKRCSPQQTQLILPFAQALLDQLGGEDLALRNAADLYGAIMSQWQFVRQRAGGTRIRVYNPSLQEHGWESPHTIVEILTDDKAFLVDSVVMEITRQGLGLHLLLHPVLRIQRDDAGQISSVAAPSAQHDELESIMYLEVDRRTRQVDLADLQSGLERVLADVSTAVGDWAAMRARLSEIIAEVEQMPLPEAVQGERAEVVAFLSWLHDNNCVLLGCRDYALVQHAGEPELAVCPDSGLGLLREQADDGRSRTFAALPASLKALASQPVLLTITKSNTRSSVHRPGYIDHFGIKRFDADGNVIGERRLIALLATTAYSTSVRSIPLLRDKVAQIRQRAGFLPNSHADKTLLTILERYPRDELFQIGLDELFGHVMGILRLGERQQTRLFVRVDPFERFVSCLIYVPRENYNTDQRQRMQAVLLKAFNGSAAEFDVQFSESSLARIHIIIRTQGPIPEFEVRDVEAQLVRALRRWEDDLQQALIEHNGEERGLDLLRQYRQAFPASYREDYTPRVAVFDIERLESLSPDNPVSLSVYRPLEVQPGRFNFKVNTLDSVPLSTSLPMLEHMGVTVLDERSAEVKRLDGSTVWVLDFGLSYAAGVETLDLEQVRPLFQDAFLQVWRGAVESDHFNSLVLRAGLGWREISVLRAYAKYMKQAAFTFSQSYMESTLLNHPELTCRLVELFQQRFDPDAAPGREERVEQTLQALKQALNAVSNLDEDRILRQFMALIMATVRTNFYQHDEEGGIKPYLSFKLAPANIPGLPLPLPAFEIFVYSPHVEGVHLRGGKVARGGLRWSDRKEDFRTEVLGLVKAQIVKNAVIVPVGSKGGFVVKTPGLEGDREAWLAEGVRCYQTFLRGLLDLTDNLMQGQVVPPPRVVRHDEGDPYLVVAADKGTASFSDYANAVAAEYRFWLGDAFASGGSVGYDHKKMGITARGAWESVKRHFREMGHDTQSEPFTVVGIGDMSGDVFGNGMLLSRQIRLIAAFDHRHIFIDPDPHPESSWQERARLFALPRSSWADYDTGLISVGGGVWSRNAKSIPLSPQARAVLAIEANELTPSELIRAILRAPVDLLYNGGIGTYIKASSESDAAVGDRNNDAVRVNGNELRCKVVGEGGNLGVTQLGRIEYALNGGRINTDAIDNSGGVDCSDHEVNIKILLNAVVAAGDLTVKQRNELLVDMTDEVAGLVLRDNYAQTQILSLVRARAAQLVDEHADYIRRLVQAGRLNRKLEFLPGDEELLERKAAQVGLVTPELAVLLAYSKIELFDALLASDALDDAFIGTALPQYFPQVLQQRFAEQIQAHPLRREIIATFVVNNMINRVGPSFVHRLQSEFGVGAADVVRAYLATREVFDLVSVWRAIEALDNQVSDDTQKAMMFDTLRLVQRGCTWFLRHRNRLQDVQRAKEYFSDGVLLIAEHLRDLVSEAYRSELEATQARYTGVGVPPELAMRIAGLEELYSALDLVEVAEECGCQVTEVAHVYFRLGGALELHWLGRQVSVLPAGNRWETLSRSALRADVSSQARALAADAMRSFSGEDHDPDARVAAWLAAHEVMVARYRQLLADVQAASATDAAMLSVLLRELRSMV